MDFPAGSLSPSGEPAPAPVRRLTWTFANLVTGQAIGLGLPERLNPGPFAARVTFFAPVSLLFFLAVMVMVGVTSGQSLHPMHYWFLSAAFFAFHLLLAYLVDQVPVAVAFAVAAAVSVSWSSAICAWSPACGGRLVRPAPRSSSSWCSSATRSSSRA